LVSIDRTRVSDAVGSFVSRSASEARNCSAACPGAWLIAGTGAASITGRNSSLLGPEIVHEAAGWSLVHSTAVDLGITFLTRRSTGPFRITGLNYLADGALFGLGDGTQGQVFKRVREELRVSVHRAGLPPRAGASNATVPSDLAP
jgi:hypothetical protein